MYQPYGYPQPPKQSSSLWIVLLVLGLLIVAPFGGCVIYSCVAIARAP